MKLKRPRSTRANDQTNVEPEFHMLRNISTAENDYLQRQANVLTRRMFRRRVKDPAETLSDLRSRLRRAGWVHIKIHWSGNDTLMVNAGIGVRLKAKLRESKFFAADDQLFGAFVRAARNVGLKPGIEDISVDVKGQRVVALVSAVPMVDRGLVLGRMIERWRDQRRAKSVRRKERASFAGSCYGQRS
jgi:hypothetical protein